MIQLWHAYVAPVWPGARYTHVWALYLERQWWVGIAGFPLVAATAYARTFLAIWAAHLNAQQTPETPLDSVDLLLARAQISLTRITLIGFLIVLAALLVLLCVPQVKASPEMISLVSAAFGVLGTILTQQNGYFFARHRQTPAPGDSPNPTQPPQAAKP